MSSHWLLRLLVPGQIAWDNAMTAFEQGNYGEGALFASAMVGEQVLTVLTLGEGKAACAAGKLGEISDWIRIGPTVVSKQLVEGPGAKGAIVTTAIKGGGSNPITGFRLPFHYHIHEYNWYKPWLWFKQTLILK